MLTGQMPSQIDKIWNTLWAGGISNPLTVIEQTTYLVLAKRLDDMHTAKEAQSNATGSPIEDPIFEPDQYYPRLINTHVRINTTPVQPQ